MASTKKDKIFFTLFFPFFFFCLFLIYFIFYFGSTGGEEKKKKCKKKVYFFVLSPFLFLRAIIQTRINTTMEAASMPIREYISLFFSFLNCKATTFSVVLFP